MKRLLLIEDHPSNRKLIGGILRRAGYNVVEAPTADEGIPLAMSGEFALVLMDVQLPGTDGLTATRILKSAPHIADMPILVVTAHAMRGDEARVMASGCDGYIAKPISYKVLLAEVARLLGD